MSKLNFSKELVDIVQIKAYCKNCGSELKCSNEVRLSYPPRYEYYCQNCKERTFDTERCPRIDYILKKKCRWIEVTDYDSWQCSECKEYFCFTEGTPKDNGYYYCPNCGAKMRERVNNE